MPATVVLPPDSIRSVGFEAGEAMLPYTARSFAGYRLLSEYFARLRSFSSLTLRLDQAARATGDRFEILIHLRDVTPPRATVTANTFQLM